VTLVLHTWFISDWHRIAKTFFALQNATGGFGGGHGHSSHLAATYAALLSIALAGGDDTYSMIDRKAMWHWLGRLKQPDGGFLICEGGEEDTRGAYCALVITSLLHLPLDLPPDAPARATGLKTFNDGLGAYLSRCQTYEGGIASSPGSEAHGAYVFCALACLSLLGSPRDTFNAYLNVGSLIEWMSSRQYAPEGGFAGRTNKLVDGCYSHWIGGCWPLVQAALNGALDPEGGLDVIKVGNLFSAEGLARYILCCCQASDGGLRDKPSK
jgi:protein farnesyltransferase subunit beta